jgi:large repetitive protein
VGSLSRVPNGSDTDNAAADWAFSATVSQGSANVG